MRDLVFQGKDNQVLTSSLLVAEKFGKRHVEVLDAVRELIAKTEKSTFVENQKLNKMFALIGKSSVSCPLKPSDSAPLC